MIDPATGFRRVFILARISDNPYLAGTAYERQLEALPEATRRALPEGRWAVFEGAVFSEWNPRIHVCDPFAIPAEWEIWRGADDGFASPAAVLWFAHDEIHDCVYVIAELYQARDDAGNFCAGSPPDRPLASRQDRLGSDRQRHAAGRRDRLRQFCRCRFADGRANVMNSLGAGWQPSAKGQRQPHRWQITNSCAAGNEERRLAGTDRVPILQKPHPHAPGALL